MRAELHSLISPDLPNMPTQIPDHVEHFGVLIQALVGASDGPGEESYDFVVCTPSWISTLVSREGFLFGRHYLIVEAYDYDLIFRVIDSLCSRTCGDDWLEIAAKLGRYGKWEFEDYRDASS